MSIPHPPSGTPQGGTDVAVRPDEAVATLTPWVTIVWNDEVNLFSYVTYVLSSYFGMPREKAETLTMRVHTQGKAVVATGTREEMERDVNAMHSFGLWATLERTE